MSNAEKYVAAAYAVFLVVVLAYLLIHSLRLARLARELEDVTDLARRRAASTTRDEEVARVG